MKGAEKLVLAAGAAYGAWWVYSRMVQPAVDAGQAVGEAAGGAAAIVGSGVSNFPTVVAQDVGAVIGAPIDTVIVQPALNLITGLPRGIRNKNPTNILWSAANDWKGQIGQDSSINGKVYCVFSDPVWGLRATFIILRAYAARGITDLTSICGTWAFGLSGRGVDGTATFFTNLHNYISTVSAVSGLPPDGQLDTTDQQSMFDFVTGLIAAENGQQFANYYTYMQMASAWSAI